MSFKKHKVVMLPTNEKAKANSIVTRPSDNRMAIVNILTVDDPQPCIHQHLYILGDEPIKEGDWYYNPGANKLPFVTLCESESESMNCKRYPVCKKIIATTDKSLSNQVFRKDGTPTSNYDYVLPEPSESFIKVFVEEFNKGNMITEVMVEYVMMYKDLSGEHEALMLTGTEYPKLKVSKDNTITIRKTKESWSREEVEQLLIKHQSNYRSHVRKTNDWSMDIKTWISENL